MFTLSSIKMYVIIAVVIAVSLVIGFLVYQNKSLTKQLDVTKTQLTEALVLNNSMKESVESQNKAIDGLLKEASINKKLHEDSIKLANEKAKVLENKATKILTKYIPIDDKTCENVANMIKEEMIKK